MPRLSFVGTESFRKDSPLATVERWHELLSTHGFSGIDIHWPNDARHKSLDNGIFVATATENLKSWTDVTLPVTVVVEHSAVQDAIANRIKGSIERSGTEDCQIISLEHLDSCHCDSRTCIFLPEIDKPSISDMTETFFTSMKTMITGASIILWVTCSGEQGVDNPAAGMSTGLARTVHSEAHKARIVTVSLQHIYDDDRTSDMIFSAYTAAIKGELKDLEPEYEEFDGRLCINRLIKADRLCQSVHPTATVQEKTHGTLGDQSRGVLALDTKSPGSLEALEFIEEIPDHLLMAADEIEVEVRSCGLIFRDVLIAMGLHSDNCFGLEFAGTVVAAGEHSRRKIGDRVYGWVRRSFSTRVRCKAIVTIPIPEEMSFNMAVAFLVGHCTAYHSLVNLARMRRGESILIHSGAGGTGQAAMQMAQYFNADIYVTVGNTEKKKLLMDLYSIPEDHIFSSRTSSFKYAIKRMTQGRGVDIVLNSLTDENLRSSVECVAPFGRFIELGHNEIAKISSANVSSNITIAEVDLAYMLIHNPILLGDIMRSVSRFIEEKTFSAPQPLVVYKSPQVKEAFRYMQSGRNVGKIVIEMNPDDKVEVIFFRIPLIGFR